MSAEICVDPERLAWLPLTFLAEQQLSLDCGDDRYRDVMVTGLWVYQLHRYRELVSGRFGAAAAQQVQSIQQAIFEREQAGAGAEIAHALSLVEKALGSEQSGVVAGYDASATPSEHRVAMALLRGLPESPDYLPRGVAALLPHYRVPGIDARFTGLLVRGRRELVQAFRPVFSEFAA